MFGPPSPQWPHLAPDVPDHHGDDEPGERRAHEGGRDAAFRHQRKTTAKASMPSAPSAAPAESTAADICPQRSPARPASPACGGFRASHRSPGAPEPLRVSARAQPQARGSPGGGRPATRRPPMPRPPCAARGRKERHLHVSLKMGRHGGARPQFCGPGGSGRRDASNHGRERCRDRDQQPMVAGPPQRLAAAARRKPADNCEDQKHLLVGAQREGVGHFLRSRRSVARNGACDRTSALVGWMGDRKAWPFRPADNLAVLNMIQRMVSTFQRSACQQGPACRAAGIALVADPTTK